jgi:hypothetical protein
VKQLNEVKSPWKDHSGRRAASVTEILKGQLPRTAQNLRNRKSSIGMVNTTAVSMGITLHTLQQTATQLKIGLKPRITPQTDKRSISNHNQSPQRDQSASQDIIQEEDSGDVCLCHQERVSQVRWQQEARKTQENCGTQE